MKPADHTIEIGLLALLGLGVLLILAMAGWQGRLGGEHAIDVAAFLLIVQRIVEAVQKRWEQRSLDRATNALANSPPAEPPAKDPAS